VKFIPTRGFNSDGERMFWQALKTAFEDDAVDAFCWHRYPILGFRGQSLEPDFLILHREWGLIIVEAKGCTIDQIKAIEGYTWYMTPDFYEDDIAPYEQARSHMLSALDRLKRFHNSALLSPGGNCKIVGHAFVALPMVKEADWQNKFEENPSIGVRQIIFQDDLNPEALRYRFSMMAPKQRKLSGDDWSTALAFMKGSETIQVTPRKPTSKPGVRAACFREVEKQMNDYDLEQHKAAVQTPWGPQRIRGLAGTGKTIVLAKKAAYMHIKYPEWDILFTFYSRSLYSHIQNLITRFVQYYSQGETSKPNWEKLHVRHGWGASSRPGVYREICGLLEHPFRPYGPALDFFGTSSGRAALDGCCREILEACDIPELYDAVLIDEGQDFAEHFYRLCFALLREPKRIIWGYDEVQSLEALEVPTAEDLFGFDEDGNPLVSLDGSYDGDIDKDIVLYHCYRNPRPVLIAAHVFGLGLLRKEGAVQFIDSTEGWTDIGYKVQDVPSGKLQTGQKATLHRPRHNSPHYLETVVGYDELVEWHVFESRDEELEWIVNDVVRNIEYEELKPHEVAILALDSRRKVVNREYQILRTRLTERGISSIVGSETRDTFTEEGAVTISSAFRAKGNEAVLVYVYGFEDVARNYGDEDVVRRRNKAFTAMTRSKGWLVLTGVGKDAETLFDEIAAILKEPGRVTFTVPEMKKIQRNLETYENMRRRKKAAQAQKSLRRFLKDMRDVDVRELSPEDRERLRRLLGD